MPITVSHVKSVTIADGTNTDIVRPSDWNSAHQFTLNATGSEISNAFSNANGISFGLSGGAITGSYTVPSTAGLISRVNVSAGTTSNNLSAVTFANGSGVTFGLDAGTMTASVKTDYLTTARASNDAIGLNTAKTNVTWTVNSSGLSLDAGGYGGTGFTSAGNNIGLSGTMGNNGLSLSATVAAQSNQSAIRAFGVSNTGQTAGNTGVSTGVDWVMAGPNSITLSQSTAGGGPNTVWIQHPAWITTAMASNRGSDFVQATAGFNGTNASGTIASNSVSVSVAAPMSAGLSNIGNTSGDTGVASQRLVLAGGNNITLSGSTNGGSMTVTISNNALTSQSNQNVTAANGGFAFQTLSFSNVNGMSFGTSAGSAITGSYTRPVVSDAIQAVGSASNSGTNTSRFAADDHVHQGVFSVGVSTGGNTAGDTRVDVGRFVLAGGNNITLSQATAANGLNTISIVGGAGGAGETRLTAYAQSNTTQSSSGTMPLSSINIAGAGIASVGVSNGSFVVSVTQTAPVVSNAIQSVGSATGSGTNTSRFAADDHVHAGVFSVGVSNVGNTAGDTRVDVGRFVFAGGNNITVSQGTAANALNTITISAANQSNQTGNVYFVGNTTGQSSSSSYDMRTLSIDGAGIASVGWSGGSIRVSATQSNQAFSAGGGSSAFQTLGFSDNAYASWTNTNGSVALTELRGSFFATSNTTQSSSGTQNLDAITFAGAGIASVGVTNGSIVISVPAGGGAGDGGVFAGVSNAGNTAGSTGTVSTGNFVLVGSRNITLSQSTGAAGSAATVTILGSPELSIFRNFGQITAAATAQGNSLVSIQPFIVQGAMAFSNVLLPASFSVASAANNSSAFMDVSVSGVLYSRNVSTLSSIASFSNSMTQTWTSNATGTVTGVIGITATLNATTIQPGEYFWAFHISSTNSATGGAATTALGHTISPILAMSIGSAANLFKAWGAQSANSLGVYPGMGIISTGATRASIAFSDYTMTGTRGFLAPIAFEMRN